VGKGVARQLLLHPGDCFDSSNSESTPIHLGWSPEPSNIKKAAPQSRFC
jgi:hypothetical protein